MRSDGANLPDWLTAGFDASMWARLRHIDALAAKTGGRGADPAAGAERHAADHREANADLRTRGNSADGFRAVADPGVCGNATTAAAAMVPGAGDAAAGDFNATAWRHGGPTPQAYDVVLAGGGLNLLVAPLLAARGLSVAVADRIRAGSGHREWNASAMELATLVRLGLCTEAELDRLIVNRYRHGTCAWYGGGCYPVPGVLDCAVDAGGLLAHARARAQATGVHLFDGATVVGERANEGGVDVALRTPQGPRRLRAAVLLDARGAASPYARADLVCPTVGGVLEGLERGADRTCIDPSVGEILATTEGVEDGRQHVWEAFPGVHGQTTVYLFYYAMRGQTPPAPLAQLYRRFARTLPRFKGGRARLVRPTFGLIPGWSRTSPPSRSPHRRIVLVGDAASRHSPLTFCGFGATLRSLERSAAHVADVVRGAPARTPAVDDRALHGVTGALAMLLAKPPAGDPQRLNRLLDAAFATLAAMGPGPYAALLQDTMPPAQALRFLLRTAGRHGGVWRDAIGALGPVGILRWAGRTVAAAAR